MLQWPWLALKDAPEQLAVPAGQPQRARPAAPPPCAIEGKASGCLVQDGPELAMHSHGFRTFGARRAVGMHTHNRSFRACNPTSLGHFRAGKAWIGHAPYPTLPYHSACSWPQTRGQQHPRRQQRQRRDLTGKRQHCASSRDILQPDVSTALKLLSQAACLGVKPDIKHFYEQLRD